MLDIAGNQTQKVLAGSGSGDGSGDPFYQSIVLNGVSATYGLPIQASSVNLADFSGTGNGAWQKVLSANATRTYFKIHNPSGTKICWTINNTATAFGKGSVVLYPGGTEDSDGTSFHHGDVYVYALTGVDYTVWSDQP